MNRADLARRNQRMAARIHRRSPRQRLRDIALTAMARIPAPGPARETGPLLIIRPDHLGDALLTMPAIQAIRRARPSLEIHLLCNRGNADLLRRYSEFDRVLPLNFPGFQRDPAANQQNFLRLAWREAKALRETGYRSALIMRPDHWWGGLLAHFAGIPDRAGYDIAGAAPFLTRRIHLRHEHAVMRNLRLASAWLGEAMPRDARLDFPVTADDRRRIQSRLTEHGVFVGDKYICIHPGSGASSKLWLAHKWALLADQLSTEFGARIIFTGSAAEQSMIRDIAGQMRRAVPLMISDTSIGELAALLQGATLALGPDSGIMHLAAAAQTATLALFGPADPIEFAPWGDPSKHAIVASDIACRPCRVLDWRGDDAANHPCVREIETSEMLAAARNVLEKQQSTS